MTRPIYEKGLALGGMYWISQNNGLIYGQTTGMISALQKNDGGMSLSESQISMITSSFILIQILGFSTAGAVADKIGRRWAFISFSVLLTLYSTILYVAKDLTMIIISKLIGGVAFGGLMSLSITITSEYTSPNSRALLLNAITTVAPAIGTGFGHLLGIVLHWRIVTLITIFSTAVGIVQPYFWVESPHWFALKGMFTECQQAFRKLHGNEAENELRLLIKLEVNKKDKAREVKSTYKRLLLVLKRRYFWEINVMSVMIISYMAAGGKVVFSGLATVMLEDITGTSDILLFTLLVDSFVFFGSVLSCVLIRKMSMRNLLFSTAFSGIGVLIILSVCLYFRREEVYFKWFIVTLLAVYFIIVNAGPYPVSEALLSEIYPIDVKRHCVFFLGIIVSIFYTLSVILYPLLVSSMGHPGLFLLNAAIMSLCLAYIWVKLPETKGKTLQEIEIYFKTKDFDVEEALNNTQMKSLI